GIGLIEATQLQRRDTAASRGTGGGAGRHIGIVFPALMLAVRPCAPGRHIVIVFVALMLAVLLAALDQMIVSTALPTIVGDLHGVNHMSWVITAYLLAFTIGLPLYGKL